MILRSYFLWHSLEDRVPNQTSSNFSVPSKKSVWKSSLDSFIVSNVGVLCFLIFVSSLLMSDDARRFFATSTAVIYSWYSSLGSSFFFFC